MSVSITNVNSTSDTFQNWLDKTNQALHILSTVAVTGAANSTGGVTSGNVAVNGIFTATTLAAGGTLRGGTVAASANLVVSSNVNFTGANVGGSVTFVNFQASNVALNAADITLSGGTLTVTSNVNFKSNTVFINTAGRLGVNTGSPDAALSVVGTANISGDATFAGLATFNSNTISKANTYISLNNGNAGYVVFGNTVNNTIGYDGTIYRVTGAKLGIDNNIILNANVTSNPSNASVVVNRGTSGTNTAIVWNETAQKWTFTNDGTNYLQFASNNDVATLTNAINLRATIASPALTGTPTAPTPANTNNSNTIATTAFVNAVVQTATASLGTMSTQNANSVVITGGSLSNVAANNLTVNNSSFANATVNGASITNASINGVLVGSNALGTRYVSTQSPTGGVDGDIWYQY